VSQASLPHEGVALPRQRGNNRITVRYRCAPATLGRLYLDSDHEFQHACVINLSRSGVGFTVARPMPCGTGIIIHMRSPDTGKMHKLPAHVVYCTIEPQGDWIVGGAFEQPLSHEILDQLL